MHASSQNHPGIPSQWLGKVSYPTGLSWQERTFDAITSGEAPMGRILGLEHDDTITLGKRGKATLDLREQTDRLRDVHGCAVETTDRGGQATLHSPGQLVVYPILPLRRLGLGARAYVEALEEITSSTLLRLGLETSRKTDEPGLYTAFGKIAFFGLRIRNGISQHGLSINVSNDLTKFTWIRSCGREAERFDRLCDTKAAQPWPGTPQDLFSLWIQQFNDHFRARLDSSKRSD